MLRGKKLVLYRGGQEEQPLAGWSGAAGLRPLPIMASGERRPVASIDSSVIQVGETDDGSVFAAKATTAYNLGGRRKAEVFGPSIYYVGESTVDGIASFLGRDLPKKVLSRDGALAMRMLRVILERTLAMKASRELQGGLLALDGSLRQSFFEPASCTLRSVEAECARRGTQLVGVTKNTKVRQLQKMEGALYAVQEPSYVDATEVARMVSIDTLGRTYMARLAADGVPLRIDAAGPEALGWLLAGDTVVRGYPETLRAAHVLSIFSPAEEASAKGRLMATEGTEVLPSFNVRRALLGTLGGSGQ